MFSFLLTSCWSWYRLFSQPNIEREVLHISFFFLGRHIDPDFWEGVVRSAAADQDGADFTEPLHKHSGIRSGDHRKPPFVYRLFLFFWICVQAGHNWMTVRTEMPPWPPATGSERNTAQHHARDMPVRKLFRENGCNPCKTQKGGISYQQQYSLSTAWHMWRRPPGMALKAEYR